jgi:hypothetical protein
MSLKSTQHITENEYLYLNGGKGLPARKAENLTAIFEKNCLGKTGATTSHNSMGRHCPVLE